MGKSENRKISSREAMLKVGALIENDRDISDEIANDFMQLLGRDFFRFWGSSGLISEVRINRQSLKGFWMQVTLRCVKPLELERSVVWVGSLTAAFKHDGDDECITGVARLIFFDVESQERYRAGQYQDLISFNFNMVDGWERTGWEIDEFDSWAQANFERTAQHLGQDPVGFDDDE